MSEISEPIGNVGDAVDRITFGVSDAGQEVLTRLVQEHHFNSEIAAFQAMAMLAYKRKLPVDQFQRSFGTKWNRGSVTPDVLRFVEWYFESKVPVRSLEQFGNAGLAYVHEKVMDGGYPLTEILELES